MKANGMQENKNAWDILTLGTALPADLEQVQAIVKIAFSLEGKMYLHLFHENALHC